MMNDYRKMSYLIYKNVELTNFYIALISKETFYGRILQALFGYSWVEVIRTNTLFIR